MIKKKESKKRKKKQKNNENEINKYTNKSFNLLSLFTIIILFNS